MEADGLDVVWLAVNAYLSAEEGVVKRHVTHIEVQHAVGSVLRSAVRGI